MKALKLFRATSLEGVVVSEVDEPSPGSGEVLVRLEAAALNHRDLGMLDWEMEAPFILGADGAGILERSGPDVNGLPHGTPVVINPSLNWGDREEAFSESFDILGWPRDGTFAEAVVVPAENVVAKPAHLTFEEAAALPLAGLTAYRAVIERARVQAGERVLIHGIGGGVALFALQFAKAVGAQVMVTSRHDEKLERARALGADAGVNSEMQEWQAAVHDWTAGAGVDVVVESLGGEFFAESVHVTRKGGRIVTYGTTVEPYATIDVETLFWHQLNLLGSTMGSPRDFARMIGTVAATGLRPVVDSVWPLAEAQRALRYLAEGQQFGKVVLRTRDC